MNLPKQDNLDIEHLQRLFDNMTECYKIFWFSALIDFVYDGKKIIKYEDLINKMITNAWYMVCEYHLNLGPSDTLEKLVIHAQKITELKSNETEEVIISAIGSIQDEKIESFKKGLIRYVPYLLQKPFFNGRETINWNGSIHKLANQINSYDNAIYHYLTCSGLNSIIEVSHKWADYFCKNYEIIQGWIHYKLIIYLQKRNPNIPGIANKLYRPVARNLALVKKYWKTIIDVSPVLDIYEKLPLFAQSISIDHFIPWSFVAHDELWNLLPTTKIINSKKSNRLPDLDEYFSPFCELEYHAYELVWNNSKVHYEFEKCLKEHVNDMGIYNKLYRPGITFTDYYDELKGIIYPLYDSAKRLGFNSWKKTIEE